MPAKNKKRNRRTPRSRNQQTYPKICPHCKNHFYASSPTAKWCSNTCKTNASQVKFDVTVQTILQLAERDCCINPATGKRIVWLVTHDSVFEMVSNRGLYVIGRTLERAGWRYSASERTWQWGGR